MRANSGRVIAVPTTTATTTMLLFPTAKVEEKLP